MVGFFRKKHERPPSLWGEAERAALSVTGKKPKLKTMTQAEWLTCQDVQKLLTDLDATDRKFRLFGVACVRAMWHLLDDPRYRTEVETTERFADGLATLQQLIDAESATNELDEPSLPGPMAAARAADAVTVHVKEPGLAGLARYAASGAAEWAKQGGIDPLHFLRDVFGNPFRPVVLSPASLTADVLPVLPRKPIRNEITPCYPYWPMPWRRPAALRRLSWTICVTRGRTRAGAGRWMPSWARSEVVLA